MTARGTARKSAAGGSTRGPRLVRKSETLTLAGGASRIVVVADTHGQPHPRAHALIARERPDRILHAGDIGDLRVLRELEAIAPTWPVRGNIDARAPWLPDVLRVSVVDGEDELFGMLLLHIAVVGPKLRADAARLAREENTRIIVCGHSHVPFIGRDGAFAIFNPGSIGPRRFHLPIVFGVIEISRERVSMKHVDSETGEVWLP